jgi:hypothetical protein
MSRVQYYTDMLNELNEGLTHSPVVGGGFVIAATQDRSKPYTLEDMKVPGEESWDLREYHMPVMMRPVPDADKLNREGWYELTELRRYKQRGIMQTVWARG